MELQFWALLCLYLAGVAVTASLAERKGRAFGKWLVFGLLCAPLALVIVAILDDYVPPRERYGPRPEPYSPFDPVDPSETEDRRAA